jgi:antitoxin component of RelBE/YafQ-DinJ toxin-antitoxin module
MSGHLAIEAVSTYPVCMNVTLSLEDDVVEEARKVAAGMGTSLNQLIRDYLRQLTARHEVERDLAELRALSAESTGDSRNWRFNRDELHERS